MTIVRAFGLLMLVPTLLFAEAADYAQEGKIVPPEGAKVSLIADKPIYMLGENVLLHYRIENTGKTSFTVFHGGDYRGAWRAMRFIVKATAADGSAAPDPYANGSHMGGLGGGKEIKPGEIFESSIQLMRYVHLPAAGEYRIRASHDLGWKTVNYQPAPQTASEVTIRVKMPSEEEAQQVFDEMRQLPRDYGTMGQRRKDFADLSVMRYAIYLPMLQDRISFGTEPERREALEAMSRMPDPAAITALLRQADQARGDVALQIARALDTHLPKMKSDYLPTLSRFPADVTWRAELAPDVRKFAVRLLQTPDAVDYGASLLQRVGAAEDLPGLIRRMDALLPQVTSTPVKDGIFSKSRDCVSAMCLAAREIIARGGKMPADPSTPGAILVYMQLQPDVKPPADLATRAEGWLSHEIPYIREAAVGAVPKPWSDMARKRLMQLAEDPDVNVRMQVDYVVTAAKDASFREPLLRRIAAAEMYWEIDAANVALASSGVKVEAMQAMAKRLDETKLTPRLMQNLITATVGNSGCGWKGDATADDAARVKGEWAKWIEAHKEELKAGKIFKTGDPQFPEALMPVNFTISTDKGDWPKR